MYLTGILARCSAIEARMALLYRGLAAREGTGVGSPRLWRELALEDETHADVLRRELSALEADDTLGAFMPELAERLERADRTLCELEQRAAPGSAAMDDAMAAVLAREQAALEDLYDDLVIQASPAFKLLCERFEAALTNAPAPRVRGLPQHVARRPRSAS